MRRRAVVVSMLLGLVAAACGGGSGSSATGSTVGTQPDPNAVINIAAPEDQWPAQGVGPASTTFDYPFNTNVYEPLVSLQSDFSLKGGLAESWETILPNTTRFHLRHGVTFHDGTPFTADAVIYSWAERQQVGKSNAGVVATLAPESVKRIDDFTVDYTPKVPNLRMPEQLVHPSGSIVPRGKNFDSDTPVGTGPWKVVSYTPGQTVVLERNEAYWGTKPLAQKLNIRFLPDPQTRVEALKSGQVDFVVDLPPNATSTLEATKGFKVIKSKPGRAFLIYVNKTEGRVGADPAVRSAVAQAINTRDYVQVVFEGNAAPGRLMAPEGLIGPAGDQVKAAAFDTRAAAATLDNAGWKAGGDGIRVKDGKRLSMKLLGQADTPAGSGEFIQAQLKAVGIDVVIVPTPDTPTRNTLYSSGKGDYDLDLEGPNQNDGNPAFLPVLRFYSKNNNTAQFAPGAAFDVLAEQSMAAPTLDAVRSLSAQMQKILVTDANLVIPLAGVFRIFGMSSKVNLGDPHPSNTNQTWFSLSKTK